MSDEIVQETTNGAVDPGQSGDRPRKSRKRGKRNRSNSNESAGQPASAQTEAIIETTPAVASPPAERERGNRRSGGQRNGSNGFGDGLDRFFCTSDLRRFPREWPVSHRRGLAIARLQEVSRRGNELLVCDQLHEGECLWPDGQPATERHSPVADPGAMTDVTPRIRPAAEPVSPVDSDA